MKKSRKRICIGLIVLIMAFIGAGFLCDKFVQALSLRTELDKALKEKNYKRANVIYKSMDKDVFFHNSLKIKNTETYIVKKNLDTLKKDFYDGKVLYTDAAESISYLDKFDFTDKKYISGIRSYIDNLNNDRKTILLSKELYKKGEYLNALDNLLEFKNSNKQLENKKKTLEGKIKNSFTNYTDKKIDEYLTKMDTKSALSILELNSKYLNKKYVTSKKDEISEFNGTVIQEKNRINNQNISSITNYLIIVDLEHQLTEIFYKKDNGWQLKKLFQSSTGIRGYDTPKGTFSIKDKGTWFFSEKYKEGAKYWVRFNNSYLFHSLPMDKKQNITDYTLGQAASHGCVRLRVSEAKWIFDNIPTYTKVIVK
ncbi:L,D-transpeptidase [Clostridium oryzae]|uniref:Putative L,D-transpeptidase YciB n=1 Tax=Clostridium oryzae TaxID=1450648 RepID=A0A1V4IX03_9CLOT|nr:L,D-transpeptidase [Clostridium oryzae]OPJ64571.1 putative L,D-transpeptidase YciB precursor [Clostridium oryzae]